MAFVRLLAASAVVFPGIGLAQKKPLDHSVYDGWKSIRSTSISRDGQWVLYVVAPQEGDSVAMIRSVKDGHTINVPRASTIAFTKDSKHVVALSIPPFADTRKARRDKVAPAEMPKSNLVIVDLGAGTQKTIEKVQSYSLATDDQGFLLYKPEPAPATPPAAPAAPKTDNEDQRPRGAGRPGTAGAAAAKKDGDPYILLNLNTGKDERIENVTSTRWDKDGDVLAYAVATKDDKGNGVVYYNVLTGARKAVITAPGKYSKLALTKDGSRLAYATDKDDAKAKKPALSAYCYDPKSGETKPIGKDSMPKDWSINEGGTLDFSEDGDRVLYHTSPKPLPDPEPTPDDEKVSVDIWNWQDKQLQPQQLLDAATERAKGYLAVYDVASGKSMQLENQDEVSISIADRGESRYALGTSDIDYEREGSWDPGYFDYYLVDVKTGARTSIAKRVRGTARFSPEGKYLVLFDENAKTYTSIDPANGKRVIISQGIPTSLVNELNDTPETASEYGIVGWTKGDRQAIVTDRYDLWLCDLSGKEPVRRLTNGRPDNLRYRPINLDPENRFTDPDHLLLDVFNDDNKQDGLAKKENGTITRLYMADKTFGGYQKAKDADTLVYTRQDFVEYPDLWLTDTSFTNPQKISETNPQQKDYNWGRAELVRWTSLDGIPLQGILIRPENFEYGKQYPMISYFYERNSDTLNQYRPPAPSASTINLPLFASNGYCIFIPDIPYKIGYPGESAINAILPGIQSIVERGYIDPKRLAIQGQSWGGYQVAYMVTRTNMFACAEAGAPVGDMFSAYGGIRYGAGVVRQFQYEHQQSRIGGTPWDSTLKYIENSPVFWVDKVQTPLMIMSNDKDGSVPHTQGIELFTALRRLNKPAWMVVYNDEDHNLTERKNRKDLSIRLSQFFDYYLKGAPMPVWMSKGVPAVDKGRTMGTELEAPKR